MQERDVRKIKQVVIDKDVVGVVVHAPRLHCPPGIVDTDEIRYQRFVGEREIAHP